MSITEKFTALFDGLEECDEEEQMQKIKEMNEMINEMNRDEFKSVFTEELFKKIHQMIEKKTLSWGNAILLLKHVGYRQMLKCFYDYEFSASLLSARFQKMIIDENVKKGEKNEKFLKDLCECFSLLYICFISDDLLSICAPCLLKVALPKGESEETRKEMKMALLALSNIRSYEIEQKLYLKEIKEIIKYHQEHQNLTRLAYQSAWQFLIKRLYNDKSLEEVIVNDLHFAREAAKELEDLSKCVDLKRKEERAKEAKEVIVIWRWMLIIYEFFFSCTLRNEELAKLTASLVRLFRAAKDKYPDISRLCIFSLKDASDKKNMEIDVLQKKGVIVLFSDEMKQSTLDDDILWNCLHFFLNISERLKEKKDDETEEEERKEMKRKIFERMEEEGYEDIVESLNGVISYIKEKFTELSKYIKDYFVNS